METPAQGVPGYYVWESPGTPVTVHLQLDVVDGLLAEVMSGFGVVPKRGAEVGGLLLGTIERGAQTTIIRVDDYEPVPCSYKRGPCYLLDREELGAFASSCSQWKPDPSRAAYAVGYFRSHTRDGLALGPEDLELLDRYFPDPVQVAMLIKPFVSKASTAAFFVRQNGAFPETTPLEFPFRRQEMMGEEAPTRRPLTGRTPRSEYGRPQLVDAPIERERPMFERPLAPARDGWEPSTEHELPRVARWRGMWVWIPMSFIFLLLGVLLGFQAALTMGSRNLSRPEAFSLALAATKAGDNLGIKWDHDAPPIRASQRGVLEIVDGTAVKSVDLDAAQLLNGSMTYHNSTPSVLIRLTVFPAPNASVTQILDWREPVDEPPRAR
jgi:hypothetical protein